MTSWGVRHALMLRGIVGRVATTFYIPSTNALLVWTALVMNCSLSHVVNLLYNFSNFGFNKLCL